MSAVLISSCVPSKFYLHFISLGERHFVSQAWRLVDLKSVRLYDDAILQFFFFFKIFLRKTFGHLSRKQRKYIVRIYFDPFFACCSCQSSLAISELMWPVPTVSEFWLSYFFVTIFLTITFWNKTHVLSLFSYKPSAHHLPKVYKQIETPFSFQQLSNFCLVFLCFPTLANQTYL